MNMHHHPTNSREVHQNTNQAPSGSGASHSSQPEQGGSSHSGQPSQTPPVPDTSPAKKRRPILPCPPCDRTYGQKEFLKGHLRTAHEYERVNCMGCGIAPRVSLQSTIMSVFINTRNTVLLTASLNVQCVTSNAKQPGPFILRFCTEMFIIIGEEKSYRY